MLALAAAIAAADLPRMLSMKCGVGRFGGRAYTCGCHQEEGRGQLLGAGVKLTVVASDTVVIGDGDNDELSLGACRGESSHPSGLPGLPPGAARCPSR